MFSYKGHFHLHTVIFSVHILFVRPLNKVIILIHGYYAVSPCKTGFLKAAVFNH